MICERADTLERWLGAVRSARLVRLLAASSLKILRQGWKECVAGVEFALNFLRSNAGIESPLYSRLRFW
jgi:hypothetical protein